MPCELGGCTRKSRKVCRHCVSWIPSQQSRYYKCIRFMTSRIVCEEPRANCANCAMRVPVLGVGRPSITGIEYKGNENYHNEYMRSRNRERRNEDQ